MSALFIITLNGTTVEVELSRREVRGLRRTVTALTAAGAPTVTVDRVPPHQRAARQLTPEQSAAVDEQMRQMPWRGDVL